MKLDSSNERYSNIIAGILVVVTVSILVAFALSMGGSNTDLPHYVSPSGVEFPYDVENEVSKINILGNNADVSIAKEWETEADPYGLTILLVPNYGPFLGTVGNEQYFTEMPDYFPLLDVSEPGIPNIVLQADMSLYHFTIAVHGCYEPTGAEIEFEQCGIVDEEFEFIITELPQVVIEMSNLLSIMLEIENVEEWRFWHFSNLEVDMEDQSIDSLEFCDEPETIVPWPDEIEVDDNEVTEFPEVPPVEIEIEIEWETIAEESCGVDFSLILSQK